MSLYATFKKFDNDGRGRLERPEFHKAWEFLGLKATPAEIDRSFDKVDVDASGLVHRYEFSNATKGSRLAELSLTVLISNMDGKLEGMEAFFENYKRKLKESQDMAAANLASNKEAFAKFQKNRRTMTRSQEKDGR